MLRIHRTRDLKEYPWESLGFLNHTIHTTLLIASLVPRKYMLYVDFVNKALTIRKADSSDPIIKNSQ